MPGPIVSQLIDDFEGSYKVIDMDRLNHHRGQRVQSSPETIFLRQGQTDRRNQVFGYKNITSLKPKISLPPAEEFGNVSLKNFVKEVFIEIKRSVFDPIKQNNTGFFKKTTVKDQDNTKVLAKISSDIFTAQQRNANEVPEFFNGKSSYHHLL